MIPLTVFDVDALPSDPAAHALYYTRDRNPRHAQAYITDALAQAKLIGREYLGNYIFDSPIIPG